MRKLALTCVLVLGCCFAQADRAALTGTITDATQAAVQGAHVTVVYPNTGLSRDTATSDSGEFRLGGLPIGVCYVEVGATGFQPLKTTTIALNVGETRTLDLTLQVASSKSEVEVTGVADSLQQSNATVGDVLVSSQLNNLPVNGRDWKSLMSLVPGAVNGNQFLSTGGDDINYRVDGTDASGVRDQNMKVYTRLSMSQDAVAEFKVSAGLFAAETGGTPGGQVEVVTKSGSNEYHGSAFEYVRNSIFDSRTPFDPATHPPFRLNEFGATLGGPVFKNKTFFFVAYEGYRQRLATSLIGYVATQSLRDQVVATSPVLTPFINAFPLPNDGLLSSQIGQWTGQASNLEDEDVGTVRVDHRFSDTLSSYFRFTRNYNRLNVPQTLGEPNPQVIAPTTGVLEFMDLLSPRSTNEFRFGMDFLPWNSENPSDVTSALSVPGLSTPSNYQHQIWHATSQDFVDSFTTVRGKHTWKAGVEVRRVLLNLWAAPTYSINYATVADFIDNKLNTASGSQGKPAATQVKTEAFGFIQDEWKIKPNLTANLGLRYDFFNEFQEAHGRTLGFSLKYCGGYCQPGLQFGNPDATNFAPRVSLAWSPERLRDKTVIRVGAGIFYGDGQLGDQQSPVTNEGWSYSLTAAITPNLVYPIYVDPNNLPRTAPSDYDRHRRSEMFQEWTAQVQQLLPWGLVGQAGYLGIEADHLSSKSYENGINPLTGARPLPQFSQIGTVGSWENSSYHALQTSLQRTTRGGLFLKLNYSWSHAINEDSQGGGGPSTPQNAACISCEKASSAADQRHSLYASASYPLPFGRSNRWGGWSLSGVNSFHTGLPLNVAISRKATALPDGNTGNQRPDYVYGQSLIPVGGQSINDWINIAAFATPANGVWGDAGRDIVTGPRLFQVDTALQKDTTLRERMGLIFRVDVFNIFNHPPLGSPNLNVSSPATFGRITSLLNTSPIGTGGCRSIQIALRLKF
ncbi:MAG TPA: carboxypeptidase regulatory-like domain-containing protein [Bryobacteraceae bacterium]|nr:carboxypeptidase regulatory-like domain-containing protein [Bryobacteraceae bacterium]